MREGIIYLILALLSIFFFFLSVQNSWSAAWNEKPVMCASHEETFMTIAEKGERLVWTAVQFTKVKGPNDTYREEPEILIAGYYINQFTRTYTVLEYHPKYLVYCVTSWGTDLLLTDELDPNTFYKPDRGVFQ